MKQIILLSLILFASCNGSHSSGNLGSSNGQSSITPKTPSSNVSEQQLVENYTFEVKSTIHRDFKIHDDDINSINSEVDLTDEEQQALNSLK